MRNLRARSNFNKVIKLRGRTKTSLVTLYFKKNFVDSVLFYFNLIIAILTLTL